MDDEDVEEYDGQDDVEIEESDGHHHCDCDRGCMDCLGMEWRDFY